MEYLSTLENEVKNKKLNRKDDDGLAAIHYAAKFNRYDVLVKLCENGAGKQKFSIGLHEMVAEYLSFHCHLPEPMAHAREGYSNLFVCQSVCLSVRALLTSFQVYNIMMNYRDLYAFCDIL